MVTSRRVVCVFALCWGAFLVAPHATAQACHPNYQGACLDPNASDYDCLGGGGNGPKFVDRTVRVVGDDPFDLDRDNDGFGCDTLGGFAGAGPEAESSGPRTPAQPDSPSAPRSPSDPRTPRTPRAPGSSAVVPVVATQEKQLPQTGSPALAFGLGGLSLVSGGGALAFASSRLRRRTTVVAVVDPVDQARAGVPWPYGW